MSRLLDEMHESMTGLHEAGLLSTDDMRKFDAACLPAVKQYTPAQIKKFAPEAMPVNRFLQSVLTLVHPPCANGKVAPKSPVGLPGKCSVLLTARVWEYYWRLDHVWQGSSEVSTN